MNKTYYMFVVTAVVLGGCHKDNGTTKAHTKSSAAQVSAVPTMSTGAPASSTSSAPSSSSGQRADTPGWSGTYESHVAKIHPPEKVRDYTWKNDDGTSAIGKGKISIQLLGGDTLRGTAEGPLGLQVVSGIKTHDMLLIKLFPKTATGTPLMTCMGTISQSKILWRGTLRCAGPKGVIVRTVSVDMHEPS